MGSVDEIINLYLPIPGVATSLIGILVIIRLILFILAANPEHKSPIKQPGNWIAYVMVAVFISPWALLVVIPLHWLKIEIYEKRLESGEGVLGVIPSKAGDAKDLAVFFVAALFAILFAQFPKAQTFLSQYFPIEILNENKAFWILGLFIFLFMTYKSLDSESFSEMFKQNIITFALVLMYLGFGALNIYLIYHLVLPFFAKLKPVGRARYASGVVTSGYGAEYAGAGAGGGVVGTFAKLFASEKAGEAASAKEEAGKAKLEKKMIEVAEKEHAAAVSERRAALHAAQGAEEASIRHRISEIEKEAPCHFWLAMIFAILSDLLDYVGAAVPGLGDILEPITAYLIGRALGGSMFVYIFAGVLALIEFIPGADLIPTYTIGVPVIYVLDYFFNPKRRELRELQRRGGGLSIHNLVYAAVVVLIIIGGMAYFQVPVGSYASDLYQAGILDVALQQKKVEIWKEDIHPVQWTKDWWSEQVALATGDAYIATVDASQSKNYGVKLEPSKKGDITFERGVPASVTADLSGNSLTSDICAGNSQLSECVIDLSCEIEGEGTGKVYPARANFSDLVFSGERVDCDFTPLEPGNKKVEFRADFDFVTAGYYKAYFIDRELKLEYQRQDTTVLEAKGLPEPEAKYTPGPIMVGIGFSEGPVVAVQQGPVGTYYEEIPATAATFDLTGITGAIIAEDRGAAIGFTLKNLWRTGKITAVHNISIILPNVLKMSEDCTPAFTKTKDLPTNEAEYSLKDPLDLEIPNFRTFNCRVEIADKNKPILTGVDVTQYYIKVIARYRYSLTAKTIVRIKDYDKKLAPGTIPKTLAYDTCLRDVTSCDYPDKSYCDVDACNQNCYWKYASAKSVTLPQAGLSILSPALGISFSRTVAEELVGDSCESCDTGMTCSYYPNLEQCQLDPCDLECEWNKEFKQCYPAQISETFIWPAPDSKIISKCIDGYNEVQISAENQRIVAPESGLLTSSEDTIEIRHPGNYKSIFSDIRPARKAGNVAKGTLIGYAGKAIKFQLLQQDKKLDLKDFYQKANKATLIVRDPDCMAVPK